MEGILARPETHDWIVDALSRETRGTLLDVPAGTGAMASRLHKMGFSVSCCDINPATFTAPGLKCTAGDLNRQLPYDSESYDFITCIEGLEHLENPFNAIREFFRILKPGGKLFVSVPNYLNIERRLRFLITGLFSKIPSPRKYGRERFDNLWMHHLLPLTFPILELFLEHSGFKVIRVGKDKEKKRMKLLLPFVWAIRLYCLFWTERKKEEYHLRDTLSRPLMMGGNTLILVIEKEVRS